MSVVVTAIGLFLTGHAQASDWYVDPLLGNDANTGASPAAAWKTITHALATAVPVTGTETIHLSDGTYDSPGGESFPLRLNDRQQIMGAGPGFTQIISPGTGFYTTGQAVSASTKISGLTIQAAGVGVFLVVYDGLCAPVLEDLRIQGCIDGIKLAIVAPSGATSASATPMLSRLQLVSNGWGLRVLAQGDLPPGPDVGVVQVRDCSFEASPIIANLPTRSIRLELDRTLVRGSLTSGIQIFTQPPGSGGTPETIVLRDSIIAHNGGGVSLIAGAGMMQAKVVGCTITGNGVGLGDFGGRFEVDNSIVWGNQVVDFRFQHHATVRHCDFVTGRAPSGTGNIHLDPEFMDAIHGDYRLKFGSPCVDTADPLGGTPTDFSGSARGLDGDLDAVGAPDMGAFELEPLQFSGTPSIGQQIGFEFLGEAGASSTLYAAHGAPVVPQQTPFGLLYLAGAQPSQSATVIAQPGPPYVLRRRIPNDPALIGTTYSFQALTDSVLAPAGRAYTNPVSFTILP